MDDELKDPFIDDAAMDDEDLADDADLDPDLADGDDDGMWDDIEE